MKDYLQSFVEQSYEAVLPKEKINYEDAVIFDDEEEVELQKGVGDGLEKHLVVSVCIGPVVSVFATCFSCNFGRSG